MAGERQLFMVCPAIVFLLAGIGAGALSQAAELTLTEKGQPKAAIVLAEAPSPAAQKDAAVFAHKMAQDLRYLAGSGLIGTDFDSCLHNWSTHGLNYHLLARLLWNPKQDVDRLIDDFCRAGFGPAASPVRTYFLRIERLTDDIAAETEPASLRSVDVTAPFTPARVTELRGMFDEAEKLAAGDNAVLACIAFLRRGLDFTDLQAQAYRFLRQESQVDRDAAHRVLDRKVWLMRDIFEQDHLAVNVAYVAWGGGARWRRLGWQWETKHPAPAGSR